MMEREWTTRAFNVTGISNCHLSDSEGMNDTGTARDRDSVMMCKLCGGGQILVKSWRAHQEGGCEWEA